MEEPTRMPRFLRLILRFIAAYFSGSLALYIAAASMGLFPWVGDVGPLAGGLFGALLALVLSLLMLPVVVPLSIFVAGTPGDQWKYLVSTLILIFVAILVWRYLAKRENFQTREP